MSLRPPCVALALMVAAAAPGLAAECPPAEAEAVIRRAASCAAAVSAYESCIVGSSFDVPLAAIAIDICESAFKSKLAAPQRKSYERRMDQCERKYERQSGSMYRSYAATCRVEVAKAEAARAAKRR